ncbi:organic solute transporter subunit alpha-like [Watersipora subatra]|uniref:organic solute transporter subunit alpha-like n=1 Tax=Watersipora subatra TaxID=2589382 RepID=UPI00355AD8F7
MIATARPSNTTDMAVNISTTTKPITTVCPLDVPNSTYYLNMIWQDPQQKALFTFSGVLCFMTLGIYMYEIGHLLRNKMKLIRRIRMVTLLSLYPIYSLLAFLAILVPRAATLMDLVVNVYFALTLWHFLQLMLMYFGGDSRMIESFSQSKISIQTPPLCCIFCCLPKFTVDKSFIRKLKIGATQFLILRPVLLVVAMILWVEDSYDYIDPVTGILKPYQSASLYISLVNMMTTLLAMWPIVILFRAAITPLAHYHIRGKFAVFQLVMICGNLQDSILTQVASFNYLKCTDLLPVKSVALEIHHLAITAEMFILSVAALAVYWKYIKEDIPLDYALSNGHTSLRRTSTDSGSHDDVTAEDGSYDDSLLSPGHLPSNGIN